MDMKVLQKEVYAQMTKLTKRKYWDELYNKKTNRISNSKGKPYKKLLKKILGQKIVKFSKSYADYLIWQVLYPQFLPKNKYAKVLEIGCAPGRFLVKLYQVFGYTPFGVEYSKSGVEITRKIFVENKLPPENVIHADFFSEQFLKKYQRYFDIVISKGFIEHFVNVNEVIDKHIELLSNRGILVVSIPNFRGINYFLLKRFDAEAIELHNLDIMQLDVFRNLFDREELQPLFCNYYGTFNFELFYTRRNVILRFILLFCSDYLQKIMNIIFRLCFRDRGLEYRHTSPYLFYIGKLL